MIDTHCHLNCQPLSKNPSKYLNQALVAGITKIIIPATDLPTSQTAIDLANTSDHLFAMIGVHPEEAPKVDFSRVYSHLKSLAQNSAVIAIGECGLDYFHTKDSQHVQLQLFELQLQLAQELNLPLSIHVRNTQDLSSQGSAQKDVLNLITKHKPRAVLHCFSGDQHYLHAALDLGLFISFAGNLTFQNAGDLQQLAKLTPLDRLLLETDAPYLNPHRGVWPNTPAQITNTYQYIANLKNVSIEQLSQAVATNTLTLFGI